MTDKVTRRASFGALSAGLAPLLTGDASAAGADDPSAQTVPGTFSLSQTGLRPGTTEDAGAALREAWEHLRKRDDLARLVIPPGTYTVRSDTELDLLLARNLVIDAHGARLKAVGSRPTLTLRNGYYSPFGTSLNGLTLLSDGTNRSQERGLNIERCSRLRLRDVTAETNGPTHRDYAHVTIGPSNPADPDTNSFWVRITDFHCRDNAAGNRVRDAIRLIGQVNALTIRDASISHAERCIRLDPTPDRGVSNTVRIESCDFEAVGCALSIGNTSSLFGAIFAFNRLEEMAHVFDFADVPANVGVHEQVRSIANSISPSVKAYQTPEVPGRQPLVLMLDPRQRAVGGVDLRSSTPVVLGGSAFMAGGLDAVQIAMAGPGHALSLRDFNALPAGFEVARIRYDGQNTDIAAAVEVPLSLEGSARSEGAPAIRNPSGSAVFAGQRQVAVDFAPKGPKTYYPEPDADYRIFLQPAFDPGEGVRIWADPADHRVDGFVIRASAPITGRVYWEQRR